MVGKRRGRQRLWYESGGSGGVHAQLLHGPIGDTSRQAREDEESEW